MASEKKKYIIKESELKEIIREMVLMEVYNPDDYKGSLYPPGTENKQLPTVGDAINGLGNITQNAFRKIIPQSWKEKAANKGGFGQWLLGSLGATAAGTAGADYLPNIPQIIDGKSQNADAHEQLNIAAACQFLTSHAHPKSTGSCARYVRRALNHGGLSLPHGMYAPSAKYYYNILLKNGWEIISPQVAGEPGDVVVVDDTWSLNRRHRYKDGHIAMCYGSGKWASDFFQRTPIGLLYPVPPERVHYFRYKNRV